MSSAVALPRAAILPCLGTADADAARARPMWRRGVAAIVTAAVLISGCAVMQPHVNAPPEAYPLPVVFAGGLNPQLVRAKLLQQRYLDQVSDEALLTNSLAVTAIPLSAAAVAVGIINPGAAATRNFLTGAGLGIAAGLGVGSFLVDRRRDAIYYGGAKSIYCLALAISPLAVEAGEFEKMRQDVEQLRLNLAAAAAAGVSQALIDQGTTAFAAGRMLVRDTAQAGPIFANELDKINIAVNAQIASEDRTIGDIAGAITAIQKNPVIIAPPAALARTQGGRAQISGLAGVEAQLRRSIELVNSWLAVYQSTATATAQKLQASQCLPATAAGAALPAQPVVVVINGQGVSVGPPGQGNIGGPAPPVINLQPPPPHIARPHAPPEIPSREPLADISNDEMKALRAVFGLSPTNATLPNSPAFKKQVAQFQQCKGEPATGRLTDKQKKAALSATDICLPPSGAAPSTGTPPAPGLRDTLPVQPPPPPIH